ncbi:endothelial differentiation-related factor 1 homolog isoform X1 [Echeneis naucrates]|uniref:endothelial differentiation-related factor 1 homolog isoform X1 n=1 Tax=Echeneis naucrates TaxID=173247 RepID=UPI0011145C63|nr:endothelial differentiation-related factor 1 isoform X1 [Echeneis naucrates]
MEAYLGHSNPDERWMATKAGVSSDEGLMMMQELDDRLKEQIDKLEHVRLAAVELKDNLSECDGDLSQAIADHLDWLNHLSERVETLHMNTTVFVQMNPKPRAWAGKQGSKYGYRWARLHQADDAQSEFGWSPIRTRRNSDAASEMSCNW